MPDLDGEMLGGRIRADDRLKHTKLVMMTSIQQRGAIERMQELGFSAYLVKPVKQSRLMDCLMEVLSSQGTHIVTEYQRRSVARLSPPKTIASKLKILLAEDSVINQKVAINQLRNLGYEADIAANGKEVLEAIARVRYDLILIDCQMPELDGYDTTRQIRQLDNPNCDIAIVAMTANAMKEDRAKCLNAGMDDYLSKPIRKEDLAAKLTEWEETILQKMPLSINLRQKIKDIWILPMQILVKMPAEILMGIEIVRWRKVNCLLPRLQIHCLLRLHPL
ncbi:MAG: response regulator [Pseudanabaena sp. SU_2_4]|nr:response regulator [Pseudanabaena sp. SU_2_4]